MLVDLQLSLDPRQTVAEIVDLRPHLIVLAVHVAAQSVARSPDFLEQNFLELDAAAVLTRELAHDPHRQTDSEAEAAEPEAEDEHQYRPEVEEGLHIFRRLESFIPPQACGLCISGRSVR